jgi:excisionase family DNA binding protein
VREVVFGNRVSVETVHRLAREGLIPAVRLGRRVLFDEDTLAAWARSGGTPESGPP